MQQQHDDDTNKVTRPEEEELQSARASVETLAANLDNLVSKLFIKHVLILVDFFFLILLWVINFVLLNLVGSC